MGLDFGKSEPLSEEGNHNFGMGPIIKFGLPSSGDIISRPKIGGKF